ncbi:MAG: efflux RND transporter permease subunit [Candidatus Cloacimonetes bacterium]|nr:efflux RND transporter permease subunit [Candidatus Cloacimonadota bacterium]
MFLSDLSVKRPVLVTMAILVFVVFGALAWFSLPLNLMPEVNLPYIVIQTVYPGAGPSEVETQVTKKIEDAIATVSLVDYTQSYSLENASIIMVAFKMQKNVDIANQEIKDHVDAIQRELPDAIEKPVVMKLNMNAVPFMDIILSGNMDSRELYELADTKLKDRFGQVAGVGEVSVSGGAKRQIDITLKDQVVFENRISLAQLLQILAAQNLDMPAGNFTRGSQEYSVRLKGQFSSLEKIADADIPTAFGMKKLRDLAEITDSAEEVRSRAIFHNVASQTIQDNVVRLSLTNASDGNVVNISEEVNRLVPQIRSDLPQGAKLDVVRDDSDFIRGTVNDTFTNIALGILLTGLVLLLFLHDWRSTLIVALSMPVSIISTFMFLQIAGYSFNLLTLIGISCSVGILVTNSVVVIENIFRHKDMGQNRREASMRGASEIALAVLASTLTNIVVFIPLASMTTLVGQFFREFALTVAVATVFSLFTAFTLTPMLASRILSEKPRQNRFGLGFDRLFARFTAWYKGFLGRVLSSKKRSRAIILVTLAVLVASFALIPVVGLEFMPEMDQGEMTLTVELPQGYNLDQTAATLQTIHQRLGKYPQISHVITTLGSSGFVDTGTHLASSSIKLVEAKRRELSSKQLADRLTRDLADIPNARIKISAISSGFGEGSGLEFYLQGQDNARLEQLKTQIVSRIKATPGLANLDTSTRGGRSELTITPRRSEMAAVGATVYDLALALRAAIEGMVSTQYHEGENQYDIKLSLDDAAVDSPDKIGNLSVVINYQPYLLSQLADISFGEGTNRITHRDRSKTVVFSADIAEGATMGDVIADVNKRLDGLELPRGYKIVWGGSAEMLADMVGDMVKTLLLAVLLTYMLLAAILESFVQPLFILGTVPLAVIGVILALLVSGQTFNLVSLMSIIMLVGIVVNNAILLLDYANLRRKQGVGAHDALMEAGEAKLKPIVMSTLAISIGMLPMALGIGPAGRELRMPMGIVVIGGLLVSAFLTLVIIPAFYYLTTRQNSPGQPGGA